MKIGLHEGAEGENAALSGTPYLQRPTQQRSTHPMTLGGLDDYRVGKDGGRLSIG
jgi:hypothetical protein